MHIFMTNDDGVYAKGLLQLAEFLGTMAKVTVIAPNQDRSSCSSALTLRQALHLTKHARPLPNINLYSLNGTPADCSKFALEYFLKNDPPDLVVSGINRGYNSGSDVIYSGTVAGALEGNFYGFPALAISGQHGGEDFLAKVIPFVGEFIQKVYVEEKYNGLINLNFPDIPNIGWEQVKICREGKQFYHSPITELIDPFGDTYYWIAGALNKESDSEEDVYWLHRNFITATPLHWNQTDEPGLSRLKNIF